VAKLVPETKRSVFAHDRTVATKAGSRIRQAIQQAIKMVKSDGEVLAHGKYLWNIDQELTTARRRTGDPAPKLDLICKEEIQIAICMVLDHQHATPADDLAIQTARVVGFGRTRNTVASGIKKIINAMIKSGALEVQSNGMVHIADA
jgi:deoxyhypusine synthase